MNNTFVESFSNFLHFQERVIGIQIPEGVALWIIPRMGDRAEWRTDLGASVCGLDVYTVGYETLDDTIR